VTVDIEDIQTGIMSAISSAWSATAVNWPGVEFSSHGLTEWIQPIVSPINGSPCRRGEQHQRGMLLVHVFFVAVAATNAYRIHELADLLGAIFNQTDVVTPAGRDIRFEEGDFGYLRAPGPHNPIDAPFEGLVSGTGRYPFFLIEKT